MNLSNAFSSIGRQLAELVRDGHDARIVGVQVDPAADSPKELLAIVETRGGALLAASFHDEAPFCQERREDLELSFATVTAITLAMVDAMRG